MSICPHCGKDSKQIPMNFCRLCFKTFAEDEMVDFLGHRTCSLCAQEGQKRIDEAEAQRSAGLGEES